MSPFDPLRGVPWPGGAEPPERSEEGAAQPGHGARRRRRPRRRFPPETKRALVEAWLASGLSAAAFGRAHDLGGPLLYQWHARLAGRTGGPARPQRPSRPATTLLPKSYSPEERRAAVEQFADSGLTQGVFAKLWGTTARTLARWLQRYRDGGPKALEPRPKGRPLGSGRLILPPAVSERIVETKRAFPWFGLRKIRDLLRRHDGIAVHVRSVRRVLETAAPDLPPTETPPRRRTRPTQIRRFERARPNELWQSDITSFLLARHRQPVYLTVFLDDFSRFIVSFHLAMHQRSELVLEALRSGIAKYGKPKEVLTDQGRQYYAWRGKSAFQRTLHREGIQHVVARAHHPQTVGKCERLWETIDREFWQRCLPEDLDDARERLALFLTHVNFHRPHQGIGGSVPADRFFAAQEASRKAIEATLQRNALRMALGERPRKPVYLYGRIGEREIALHGERGELILQTAEGQEERVAYQDFGGGGVPADAVVDPPPGAPSDALSPTERPPVTDPEETSDEQHHEQHDEPADEHDASEDDEDGDGDDDGSDGGTSDDPSGDPRAGDGAPDLGRASTPHPAGEEAAPLQASPAPGLPGAGAVGGGE